MSDSPKCLYCDREMDAKCHTFNMWDTKFYFECSCGARTPMERTPEAAYAAAMKRDRAKGEWIERTDEYSDGNVPNVDWYCSVCGEDGINDYNYCPNCGAKMNLTNPRLCPNCGADMRKEKQDEDDRSNNKN